jgi:Cof subfamily protein (haloacid dehalogenase superfamily)
VALGLVCLDVDGTLVGHSGSPTEGVWRAAQTARAAGIHLALCTARPAIGLAWEWASRLDPEGWHMFQTGASLMHTGTRATESAALPPGAAATCASIADSKGWVLECYSDSDYIVDNDSDTAVAHAGLMGLPFKRRSLDSLSGVVLRVQFVVSDADLAAAEASIPTLCVSSAATSPIMPGVNFLSVTHQSVSKASGVQALAKLLGLDASQVMMVGDGQNDVSALQVVGHPVAMGNGHADAKAVAKYVVADVEHDGVAEALELARTLG